MISKQNRVLIFGAGVIGSAYAVKFIEAGIDVTLFARSKRYASLKKEGLGYNNKGRIQTIKVKVIDKLENNDSYDFIFVAVRYDKAESALRAVKENKTPNVVTLISNSAGFSNWQNILGDRLIPGFSGVGGQMNDGILNARYLPKFMVSTNFGEVDGVITDRIEKLAKLFNEAKLPYTINKAMNAYLITHAVSDIAMLGSLYSNNEMSNKEIAQKMVTTYKSYLRAIQKAGIIINPSSSRNILKIPDRFLRFFFTKWLKTKMVGEMKLPEYAVGASNEITKLNKDLVKYLEQKNIELSN
ncbi:ketopantoate reductase family protein [Enterococcus pingfangensis]|uniref:ketopantoate reductase family protein n=1 Tax=Enterococcus pingfangensis TaxID=2559924 RepID=UPI0010F500AB|nr:2-dehydropantoate 2-reductase N-terminal domain-containing protein [Enterococcus pingfangensis]